MTDVKDTSEEGHKSDPSLVGPEDTHSIGMKGDAAPGSHSAVFGLTPDGHAEKNTDSKTTMGKVKDGAEKAMGGGTKPSGGEDTSNTSSTAAGTGGVADQLQDSKMGSGGQGGPEGHAGAGSGDKPGSGFDGPSQGTGQV